MRLEGLRFILDAFSILLERAIDGKHVDLEVGSTEVILKNRGGPESAELCNYLHYLLYGLGVKTIEQITQILGSHRKEIDRNKMTYNKRASSFNKLALLL